MEEIKENEYIRTTQGTIARIEDTEFDICYNTFNQLLYKNWIMSECFYEEIVKHSSNIKDLIQAGDIVIYTINCKMTDIEIVKEHTDARTFKKTLRVGLYSLEQVNIKQILTKERFESESYRLEE